MVAKGTVSNPLIIATRESRLAIWQAKYVQSQLEAMGLHVQLLGLTTRGDQILDTELNKIGGKGLFVKELESALLNGRADMAVHSLKDVPMNLPPTLELAAMLKREDPRDAWVSNRYPNWHDLPQGAVIGTSSTRRRCLLGAWRPDLRFDLLRGNLDTRLKKLNDGGFDGIVLAAAGLIRLELGHLIAHHFDFETLLPSPAQGIMGIEVRSSDAFIKSLIAPLSNADAWLEGHAERAVSRALSGDCSIPLAAHATLNGNRMTLSAALGRGAQGVKRVQLSEQLVKSVEEADHLGKTIAKQLLL